MSATQIAQVALAALRPRSFIDEEEFERRRQQLQDEMRQYDDSMRAAMLRLDRWPHRHMRHFERLQEFLKDGPYEQSVFVMTKYSQDGDHEAERLKEVIDFVVRTVERKVIVHG